VAASRLQTTLGDRTKALCANIVVFDASLYAASGNLLPTGGLESVWFLSSLALWFLALLSAPWFVPPKDALANALGAMAILVTADLGGVGNLKPHLEVVRWIAVAYCAATMVGSVVALFIHDKNKRSPIGRFFFRITDTFGQGELLYTPPALISIIGAYQSSLTTITWLTILWTMVAIGRPAERLLAAWKHWQAEKARVISSPTIGTIERIDHPDIVKVEKIRTLEFCGSRFPLPRRWLKARHRRLRKVSTKIHAAHISSTRFSSDVTPPMRGSRSTAGYQPRTRRYSGRKPATFRPRC
jgi:hypothetical protein